MPQYVPPVQQPVDQQQSQTQSQLAEGGDVYVNDNESKTYQNESRADNVNQLGGHQSFTQINNTNSGEHEFEYGVRIPTTSLTIGGWATEHDYGVQIGINIPLGGGVGKRAKRQVEARIRERETEVVARKLKVCDNLYNAGYEILDYDALELQDCQNIRRTAVTPVANASSELEMYKQELAKSQAMIQALLKRLDEMSTERGTEFRTNG